MKKDSITVETVVNVTLRTAWEHWTQPRHIMNWNFASDDWHCPAAKNELRPGGNFSYTMSSKDGQHSFDFEGTYSEIDEGKKIRYSIADGRDVEVLFRESNGRTTVIETFEPENMHSKEMQKAGWQSILDNFKTYVERTQNN